jgi:hypothetical protein
MILNKGMRELGLNSNKSMDDYMEYVEVLEPKKKNEKSDIEKRFKKSIKDLNKVQKQIDSAANEVKHRIREVRKEHGNQLVYEKDMYQTLTSLLTSKITAIDKKSSITKNIIDLEMKEKKLNQKDVGGVGNDPRDMRGTYAQFFSNDSADTPQLNGSFLTNPEKNRRQTKRRPTRTEPRKRTKEDIANSTQPKPNKALDENKPKCDPEKAKKKSSGNINADLEEQYGINYGSSAANLRYKDKDLKEVMHLDLEEEIYWIEVQDEEGHTISDARKKNIETLGDINLNMDEGVVTDSLNNSYEFVEDKKENMPEHYREQWRQKGKEV